MTSSLAELVTRCLDLRADAVAEAHHLTRVVADTTEQGSLHDAQSVTVVYELAALVMQIDRLTNAVRLTQRIADAVGVSS